VDVPASRAARIPGRALGVELAVHAAIPAADPLHMIAAGQKVA